MSIFKTRILKTDYFFFNTKFHVRGSLEKLHTKLWHITINAKTDPLFYFHFGRLCLKEKC